MPGQKKGFRHSLASRARISATLKGRVPLAIHVKRQCPTCGVVMGAGNMGRHAPVCKQKVITGLFPGKTVKELKTMRRRLRPYGLDLKGYNDLWMRQGGVCAICGSEHGSRNKVLAVDHSHKTNAVRGLLCDNCNILLGKCKDSVELLERAMVYLTRTEPSDYERDGWDSATPKIA